jgi:hypothetical protein
MDYDTQTDGNLFSAEDHYKSFEEVHVGNPGREEPSKFRVRTAPSRGHFNPMVDQACRAQHLVKKAGGKLHVFKAEGTTLQVRRTEFDLQPVQARKNLMNDPPILVEFDSTIAQGLWLEMYKDEGEYTCSLFVPLINNYIVQLYFTQDGLKMNSEVEPYVNITELLPPTSLSKGYDNYSEEPGLVRVEKLFHTKPPSAIEDQCHYMQKVAVSHGNDLIYIYDIPVCPNPTGIKNSLSGGVLSTSSNKKANLWSGIKDSIYNSFGKSNKKIEEPSEIIEDLKYLGSYLLCGLFSKEGDELEARVLNLITGELLAKLSLPSATSGTSYMVKIRKPR